VAVTFIAAEYRVGRRPRASAAADAAPWTRSRPHARPCASPRAVARREEKTRPPARPLGQGRL